MVQQIPLHSASLLHQKFHLASFSSMAPAMLALSVIILLLPEASSATNADLLSSILPFAETQYEKVANQQIPILGQTGDPKAYPFEGLPAEEQWRSNRREGWTSGFLVGAFWHLSSLAPADIWQERAQIAQIYNIVVRQRCRSKVSEAGVVPLLVGMLVDADQSIYERALLALDTLCCCTEGRAVVAAHALTLPVVVKKMLRLSESATELAVSVLWNICQNSCDGEAVRKTLHAGALDKLMLVVQMGCSTQTRFFCKAEKGLGFERCPWRPIRVSSL